MRFKVEPSFLWWRSVAAVTNNEFSRIASTIPFVGYLLLMNDQVAQWISFNELAGVATAIKGTVVEDQNSPFLLESVTKLRLIFFGSILLLISISVCRAYSPRILTHSESDIDFSLRAIGGYSRHEISSLEEAVFNKSWQPRLEAFWRLDVVFRIRETLEGQHATSDPDGFVQRNDEFVRLLAREYWFGQMHINWAARYISLGCGLIGYILLALPTLDVTQAVIRNTLGFAS